jgi:PHD/YefM family antitoxin component YafN of YafNO toxin-antitoxin module
MIVHILINTNYNTINSTINQFIYTFTKEIILQNISANELKTKGIAAIETILAEHSEAIVSVRGKNRFVVMEIAQYNFLRECELEAALAETRADLTSGKYVQESAEAHLARLDNTA